MLAFNDSLASSEANKTTKQINATNDPTVWIAMTTRCPVVYARKIV